MLNVWNITPKEATEKVVKNLEVLRDIAAGKVRFPPCDLFGFHSKYTACM